MEELLYCDPFPGERYDEPVGDMGLYGPDSVTWRVHGDPSMLVGGLAGVMLATLHPAAMAVVAQLSHWQEQPFHRLSRTASYIRVTTYASEPVADRAIEQVKGIHRKMVVNLASRVHAASDPDLLCWVHVAEASCFLGAYQRYGRQSLTGAEEDRYFAEVAVVAQRLGATGVPASRDGVAAYFERLRPLVLDGTAAALDNVAKLRTQRFTAPSMKLFYPLAFSAAIDLLPSWARDMLHLSEQPALTARAMGGLVAFMRLARGVPPVIQAAKIRCR